MRRSLFFLLLLVPALASAQETPLEAYIQEGLRTNLTIQQRRYDLAVSRAQVREARGQYWPSLGIEARYTRAGGGRTIDFPVGDLLNPAYGALNDLLAGQGQPAAFPTLENQRIAFLRSREQETKMRLVLPVFQPAIRHDVKIRSRLSEAQAASVDAARRQLVADVKTGYFDYLRAERVIEIFEATLALVRENLRVNERLVKHGKATPDAVYRAEAEVSAVEQRLAEAQTRRDLAASYFNTLLNRPLDAPIERMTLDELLPMAETPAPLLASNAPAPTHDGLAARALGTREELEQLRAATAAADASLGLARSAYLPNVSFVLDYGIQGTGYGFSGDSDFRAASLVLSWNLFDGLRKNARIAQARLRRRTLETRQADLRNQIRLQVQQAADNLSVARRSIETAERRLRSARQSFRLTRRRFEEGMASQVDFIDARTALTNAELNLALTRFDLLIRHAVLERVAALYPL